MAAIRTGIQSYQVGIFHSCTGTLKGLIDLLLVLSSLAVCPILRWKFSGVTFDLPSLPSIQPLSTTFDDESQFSPHRRTEWL
nr:hypothetical protein [Tanacetum cinerariifolium]